MCFSITHIVSKFQFSIRTFTVVKLKNKPVLTAVVTTVAFYRHRLESAELKAHFTEAIKQ